MNFLISKRSDNTFNHLILFVCLLLVTSFMTTACEDQRLQTVTWTEFEPVYMSEEDFESSVTFEGPKELNDPGKIYIFGQYLFVNEINEGVHIIDNSDPASPAPVGFINIPANKDIAVKDDVLYADSGTDLLAFDISIVENAELIERKEDVFEFSGNASPGFPFQAVDQSKGVVVDWKPVKKQRTCEGDCYPGPVDERVFFDALASSGESAAPGIGGSMARFAITGTHLYAVDDRNLLTFDISSPGPQQVNKKDVGWAIETIFPYNENLFIGSRSAMYIFSIENASAPSKLSDFPHSTACDPVVVEGDIAYVTLRNSFQCPQGLNRLEVIDVSDLFNPQRISFYEMKNPHGLGIDNGTLFIAEGDQGLKILDASNPDDVKLLRHITEIRATDVIPFNNVLIVTGEDGIIQYNYSDINDIQHLSTIVITPEDNE